MDTIPIKLRELSPIIIGLIEKIQILDSVLITKQKKLDCTNELIEIVADFRSFFEEALTNIQMTEQTNLFKDRVERAFSRFEWDANVGVSPHEFQKHSENAKTLLSSMLKIFGMKGCGILIIEIYLKLCLKIVGEMSATANITDQTKDKHHFKLLLDSILTTASVFNKYWHIMLLPNQRNAVALCLNQLCKVLPFLLKMIRVRNVDVKKFALRMSEQGLNRILEEIHSEGNLQPKDWGQEFIILMDFSLNKLNGLANDSSDSQGFLEKAEQVVPSVKPMIDEILCYGMSVSQVTQSESDRSAIMNGSLKVIREYKDLSNSLSEGDVNNIKLNAQSVGESLCAMERHVNRAVLRLVLEVFTGINCPLKNIVNKCRTNMQNDNKASDDLNSLIFDFDSEMDKIMQIGLFAISCTSDSSRILGIQSCLASLESLETELIPSLTSLYMDCSSRNKSNFQHLIDLWLNEITELKVLIDSILDPAGFCEIVENQIRTLVKDLKVAFYDEVCLSEAKSIIYKMTRYSRKLMKTLRSQEDESDDMTDVTEEYLRNFQLAVQDCEAVQNLLESREDGNGLVDKAYEKAEFLHEELKRLSAHLFALVIEENSETECEGQSFQSPPTGLDTVVPKKNYYRLCYSAEEQKPETPNDGHDMEVLTPYINKGILKSKRRSVLYTTPSQAERELKDNLDATLFQARRWDKTPVSKKRSRCCKPLNENLELANTVDLEITSILENLSHLNGTFVKSLIVPDTPEARNREATAETGKRNCTSTGKGNQTGPTYKSSGCCADLDAVAETKLPAKVDEGGDKHFPGTNLRNRFLESLNELSQNASLVVSKEDIEFNTDLDTPDRLNDLKIVDEKIDFLKQQVPYIVP